MNEKLDLTKILKDCPKGMELDCTMYDNVTLKSVSSDLGIYPICIEMKSGFTTKLTKYGQNIDIDDAKCVIFPKGKTTWEGFHRPFVDGDIIYVCDEYSDATFTYVAILKQIEKGGEIISHCFYNFEDNYFSTNDFLYDGGHNARFATEKEKEKLFQSIKDNGYEWDVKTKTLKKLIVPKFKVGDTIRSKNGLQTYKITGVTSGYYSVKVGEHVCVGVLSVKDQDNWMLVPNKFNPKSLQPFDKVLVTDALHDVWYAGFFSHINPIRNYQFIVDTRSWRYCIPYNDDTKHLAGKSGKVPEFYRYWE
jgi:hypothetical protein